MQKTNLNLEPKNMNNFLIKVQKQINLPCHHML